MLLEHAMPGVDLGQSDQAQLLPAMWDSQGDQFFAGVARVLPRDDERLPYYLALFRAGLFAPDLFDRHAIDFPLHIRNSVLKRQAEFIAGRLCARSILDVYGLGQHVVAVGKHREPMWPDGFIGSITHSGQYAAAIACPGEAIVGVGIDIETIIESDGRQAMMDLVVCEEELAYLHGSGSALGIDCLLTLVFSAKESFFKAAYPQVKGYFDFDAVKVFHIDEAARIIHFRCAQDLSEHLLAGQEHQAHFNFIGDTSVFTAVLLYKEGQLETGPRQLQAA
jgi:enterobactin synthetase component D